MRLALSRITLIIALALIPAAGSALFHPKRPPWVLKTSQDELPLEAALQLKNPIWVDARSREHFEQAHIPGALPLNLQEWDSLLGDFLDRWEESRPVVVYCGSDACDASREVAARLRDEVQIRDVHVLKGGWEAWRAAQK